MVSCLLHSNYLYRHGHFSNELLLNLRILFTLFAFLGRFQVGKVWPASLLETWFRLQHSRLDWFGPVQCVEAQAQSTFISLPFQWWFWPCLRRQFIQHWPPSPTMSWRMGLGSRQHFGEVQRSGWGFDQIQSFRKTFTIKAGVIKDSLPRRFTNIHHHGVTIGEVLVALREVTPGWKWQIHPAPPVIQRRQRKYNYVFWQGFAGQHGQEHPVVCMWPVWPDNDTMRSDGKWDSLQLSWKSPSRCGCPAATCQNIYPTFRGESSNHFSWCRHARFYYCTALYFIWAKLPSLFQVREGDTVKVWPGISLILCLYISF